LRRTSEKNKNMTKQSMPDTDTGVQSSTALKRYQSLRRLWLAVAIMVVAAVLLFISSAWAIEAVHDFTEAFGLTFIGMAVVGRLWCTLYIGGRKSGEIVSSGPYSISRNPLYVFSTIGAVGVGAQSGSLIVAFLFGLLCYLAFSIVTRREEKFLAAQFPQTFAQYVQRVPRFFPRFALYRDEPSLTVMPARLYTTFVDGLVFFAAVPAFEAVEYLQDSGALPVLLHLY
jgi:protein-S-isoprenylcysteine O-methyltransferase Ste14